ncbi:MAG: hypothetical protein L0L69_05235, partial [Propionibacterium sp.]|nr:hypothetical protein [Propionibacterium sp.]
FHGSGNVLSAGAAGDAGSARLWTRADVGTLYRAEDSNVRIEKPDASGIWVPATWETRCLDRTGAPVTLGWSSQGRAHTTESQVVVSGGTGKTSADGSTTVSWKGSWTVAHYDGMTYRDVSDPTLTLDTSGNGQPRATAAGYGTHMDDTSKWEKLAPTTVVLADLAGVDVTGAASDHGFTHEPTCLGVAINDSGGRNSQARRTATNGAYWGSFPQGFIDFQVRTGQSSYWYTSEGRRDRAKIAAPLSVAHDAHFATPTASESVPRTGGRSASLQRNPTGVQSSAVRAGRTVEAGTGAPVEASPIDWAQAQGVASDTAPGTPGGVLGVHDSSGRIAPGAGEVALASGAPLLAGWISRRRLGLDPATHLTIRTGK